MNDLPTLEQLREDILDLSEALDQLLDAEGRLEPWESFASKLKHLERRER
jgi:hypothetical protein